MGTVVGGPRPESFNRFSFDFDSTDDYIDCGDADNLSFGDGINDFPFSMSAWIKVTEGNAMYIISKQQNIAPLSRDEYAFYISSTSKKLIFFLIDADLLNRRGRTTDVISSSTFANWMHVAVTYNGVGGSSAQNGLKLFINGVRSDTTDSNKNTYTAMHNFSTPFRIGAFHDTLFGEGNIDEVSVFNSELSEADITNIYNNGVPIGLSKFSSLISWWRMGDKATYSNPGGVGNWTLVDQGSGGNDGTSNGMDENNRVLDTP